MRKRLVAGCTAGVVSALALALGACAGGAGGSGGPVTITYETPATTEVLNKGERPLIQAFEKVHPKIKVKIEQTPIDNYNTKLVTQFRAGEGPDLGRVNYSNFYSWNASGFIAPLDDAIKQDHIDTSVLISDFVDAGKVNGKQMVLPLTTDTRVLYYNPKLLKSKGISSAPRTWDDLVQDVEKFSSDKSVYGYGFVNETDYSLSYETIGPYAIGAGGGKLVTSAGGGSPRAATAENPGSVAAVQLLQRIVKTGEVPGVDNVKADTLSRLFAQGKLAFMLGGPWVRTDLQAANPKLTYGSDVATTVVPTRTENEPGGSTAGGWYIGIYKNSEHQAEAGQLLAYLMKKENIVKLNAPEAFPPVADALANYAPWKGDHFYDAFNQELPHAARPYAAADRVDEISATYQQYITPVLVDPNKSAMSALRAYDDAVNNKILK